MNFAAWMYEFAHDLFCDVVFAIWDDTGFDLTATFQDSHDYSFAMSALHATIATEALPLRPVHVSCFTADKSLIRFDRSTRAAELCCSHYLHSKPNAIHHEPCCFLIPSQTAF